jgi:GAF domain-containing protein
LEQTQDIVERLATIVEMASAQERVVLRSIADLIAAGAAQDVILERAVALLKATRPYYTWFGVYLLKGDTLVLGPYIGRPTEHTRIPIGQGICGLAARTKETVNVADVNSDPRYLACSIETKSELVVPIMDGATVRGEIDVDSDTPAAFTKDDEKQLQAAADLLAVILR